MLTKTVRHRYARPSRPSHRVASTQCNQQRVPDFFPLIPMTYMGIEPLKQPCPLGYGGGGSGDSAVDASTEQSQQSTTGRGHSYAYPASSNDHGDPALSTSTAMPALQLKVLQP